MEIERKFLVLNEDFIREASRVHSITQGYLAKGLATIRIRLRDDEAFITIKGITSSDGTTRPEWEYPIPLAEAEEMIQLSIGNFIKKKRYLVPFQGHTWEVDVFDDELKGLVVAEIELSSADEDFAKPSWVGEEVTLDFRYHNTVLHQYKDELIQKTKNY